MTELRPAAAEDEALLLRVYASTRQAELDLVDWSGAQKEAFVRMQFDARERHYRQHYAGGTFDVVVVDGEPVGLLYVARWPAEIRIVDVALLPEHRGRGIGTALIEQVLDEGSRSGKPVTIHVERFNAARHLYTRLGFVPLEDKGVYLLLARHPERRAEAAAGS